MTNPTPIDVCAAAPAVVLETAFLTRGLPADVRLGAARRMAAAVVAGGATPAFTGVLRGRAIVGLTEDELERLAPCGRKLAARDLGPAIARGEDGGTTVSATLVLARRAGLRVAATGGIGGVHPAGRAGASGSWDVSADLEELARTPAILVCSGAKAITDIGATMERLETLGVPVVGWKTRELPAFWSRESGVELERSVEGAEDAAAIRRAMDALGQQAALLVCAPPPADTALAREESDRSVAHAVEEAAERGIAGPGVTPWLLARIAELTDGRSLRANLALLEHNAGIGAGIARALSSG